MLGEFNLPVIFIFFSSSYYSSYFFVTAMKVSNMFGKNKHPKYIYSNSFCIIQKRKYIHNEKYTLTFTLPDINFLHFPFQRKYLYKNTYKIVRNYLPSTHSSGDFFPTCTVFDQFVNFQYCTLSICLHEKITCHPYPYVASS